MIDIHSTTWRTLTKVLDDEIEQLHQRLEQFGLPEATSHTIRGEIRANRKILALASPSTPEGGGTPDYGHAVLL